MPSYPWRVAQFMGIRFLRMQAAPAGIVFPPFYQNGDVGNLGPGLQPYQAAPFPNTTQYQPCLNHAGAATLATAWQTDLAGGTFDLQSGGVQKLWDGFTADQDIIAPSIMPSGASNILTWTGQQMTTNPALIQGPYMVVADHSGTETARCQIRISNPQLDTIFRQIPPPQYATFGMAASGSLWACALNVENVLPPSILCFTPDCLRCWMVTLVAVDDAALAALSWPNFGAQPVPAFSFASNDLGATQHAAHIETSELMMTGWGTTTDALLFRNTMQPRLLPPFPPVLEMPCVPCQPMQIDGQSWAGRLI